jgi:hypothetical protein
MIKVYNKHPNSCLFFTGVADWIYTVFFLTKHLLKAIFAKILSVELILNNEILFLEGIYSFLGVGLG